MKFIQVVTASPQRDDSTDDTQLKTQRNNTERILLSEQASNRSSVRIRPEALDFAPVGENNGGF